MALPKGDQYNEAVQNPQVSFADADLRAAKVETGMFDLPKPYSGGFTVTFKLQNNSNSWAVRCMIRDISELQRRYQAITDFFASKSSKYFIDAKYLQNGIKINGSFYPIIKMKWMDGEPLNIYLSNNYNNRAKVEAILNDFKNLVHELDTLGIAHGDLQHGNIIVKNDRLFLIDYDGMYLPALNGLKSNELGHPNFQHPQRTGNNFNAKIDRFSSILIYLSLKALIYKPTLWNKYHNSENLIIKSQDIGDLTNSPVIADLNAIPEIKPLVERFAGVCHLDFDKIPSLNEFIAGSFAFDKSKLGKITVKRSQYEILDGEMKGTILEHYGERVEVVGYITDYFKGRTFNGKPYYFLNVGRYPNQTFTITIWSEGISALTGAGKSPTSLVGKWVSVIGIITSYAGRPQTVAELASQIQILSNEQEAKERLRLKRTTPTAASSKPVIGSTTTTNSKKIVDKEADVFGNLYGHIPASKPIPNPAPKTILPPAKPYNTPYQPTTPAKTTTSSISNSSSNNSSCLVTLGFVSVAGLIGAAIAQHGGGFIIGAIIGFAIHSLLFKN